MTPVASSRALPAQRTGSPMPNSQCPMPKVNITDYYFVSHSKD
ncbi:hypothetical protein [Nostoc sp.]